VNVAEGAVAASRVPPINSPAMSEIRHAPVRAPIDPAPFVLVAPFLLLPLVAPDLTQRTRCVSAARARTLSEHNPSTTVAMAMSQSMGIPVFTQKKDR